MADMAAQSGRAVRPEISVWPWSTKVAVILAPAILVVLVAAIAVSRAAGGWPTQRFEGWALLAVVVLSLLPVILVLVQTLAARGGSIQLPGISLSFVHVSEEVASALRTTTLAENLGTPGDVVPLEQSSLQSILRALRRAHDSEVTVVDLRRGRTWWESRLFILVAGAARRDLPAAIAFIADRNGKPGAYLGWAPPARLLDMHMSAMPVLGEAYDSAVAKASIWQIGTPAPRRPGTAPYVTLPWNSTPFNLPPITDEAPNPAYALELFLQQDLDHRPQDLRQYITVRRLLELYESVLMTDSVDADADDAAWARLLASNPRRYFALTAEGAFKALIPRDSLLAALVARMVEATNQPVPSR